jgi:hypothetical protein
MKLVWMDLDLVRRRGEGGEGREEREVCRVEEVDGNAYRGDHTGCCVVLAVLR